MFRRLLILSMLLLFSANNAFGWEPDLWTTEQKILAGVYSGLLWADWKQTKVAQNQGRTELNPALGSNPSGADIDQYFLSVAALSGLVLHVVPEHVRTRLLYLGIGVQGNQVWFHWSVGVRF